MCGILFVDMKNGYGATKPILKRYRKQATRGKQGYGYVTICDGVLGEVKKFKSESDIISSIQNESVETILFHHRMPTGGVPNLPETAHPFEVKSDKLKYNYTVVHNGVITNFTTLFERYKKEGYEFSSEYQEAKIFRFTHNKNTEYLEEPEIKVNDSECFAVDLANYLDGKNDRIEAIGTISFVAIQTEKDGRVRKIIYGHNQGNPLVEENDNTIFCLRSEGTGGGMRPLTVDKIYSMDWATKEITSIDAKVGFRWYDDKYPNREKSVGYGSSSTKTEKESSLSHAYDTDHTSIEYGGMDNLRFLERNHPALLSPIQKEDLHKSPIVDARGRTPEEILTEDEWGVFDIKQDDKLMEDESMAGAENLQQEVEDMLYELSSDDDIVRSLRKALRDAHEQESAMLDQLYEARDLLRTAIQGGYDEREVETAQTLVQAAKEELKTAQQYTWATLAELDAHLTTLSGA